MKRKALSLILAAALLAISLAGCGGSNAASQAAYAENGYYDEKGYYGETAESEEFSGDGFFGDYGEPASAGKTADTEESPAEEKLVYTANARLETKEIGPALDYLYGKIEEYQCVIESEQVYNIDAKRVDSDRYYFSGGTPEAEFTVRVPSQNYDAFLKGLKADPDTLYVQSVSSSVENLTRSYYDAQARISALKSEEQWLLSFMEEAETVSEMLEIKDRLTQVQYEIDQLTTHVNTIDYDVNYSTVNINLVEVRSYTESRDSTFLERLGGYFSGSGSAFLSFAEGALEALIYLLPYLLIAGLIALIAVKAVRASRKKHRRQSPLPPYPVNVQQTPPPAQPQPPAGQNGDSQNK